MREVRDKRGKGSPGVGGAHRGKRIVDDDTRCFVP